VRQHVSPGLPAETAHARMEECGFHCLYGGMFAKMPKAYHPNSSLPEMLIGRDARKDKRFHTLVCTLVRAETGNWGRRCFPLTVLLPYDENGLITEVEVPKNWPHDSYCAGFFTRRPDLREPVGLTKKLDEARRRSRSRDGLFPALAHLDEAEAARAAGFPVRDDLGPGHGAVRAECLDEVIGGGLEGKVSDIDALAHNNPLGLAGPWYNGERSLRPRNEVVRQAGTVNP